MLLFCQRVLSLLSIDFKISALIYLQFLSQFDDSTGIFQPNVSWHSVANTVGSVVVSDETSEKYKVAAIGRALSSDPVDVTTLRQLAISRGGLLNNDLRCKAWPLLLDVDVKDIPEKPGEQWLTVEGMVS